MLLCLLDSKWISLHSSFSLRTQIYHILLQSHSMVPKAMETLDIDSTSKILELEWDRV